MDTHTHTHRERSSCLQSVRIWKVFHERREESWSTTKRNKWVLIILRFKYFSVMYKYFTLRSNQRPFLCAAGCLVSVIRLSETVWTFPKIGWIFTSNEPYYWRPAAAAAFHTFPGLFSFVLWIFERVCAAVYQQMALFNRS